MLAGVEPYRNGNAISWSLNYANRRACRVYDV